MPKKSEKAEFFFSHFPFFLFLPSFPPSLFFLSFIYYFNLKRTVYAYSSLILQTYPSTYIPAGHVKIIEKIVSVSTKYWTVVTIPARTVSEEHHYAIDNCKKAWFLHFVYSILVLIYKIDFLMSKHFFW